MLDLRTACPLLASTAAETSILELLAAQAPTVSRAAGKTIVEFSGGTLTLSEQRAEWDPGDRIGLALMATDEVPEGFLDAGWPVRGAQGEVAQVMLSQDHWLQTADGAAFFLSHEGGGVVKLERSLALTFLRAVLKVVAPNVDVDHLTPGTPERASPTAQPIHAGEARGASVRSISMGPELRAYSVAFSPDGRLWVGLNRSSLGEIDVGRGEVGRTSKLDGDLGDTVAIDARTTGLLGIVNGAGAQVVSVETLAITVAQQVSGYNPSFAVALVGDSLISYRGGEDVCEWSSTTGELRSQTSFGGELPCALSADGSTIGFTRDEVTALVLDRATEQIRLEHETGGVSAIVFSSDGNLVAVASEREAALLEVFELGAVPRLRFASTSPTRILAVAFDRLGEHLVVWRVDDEQTDSELFLLDASRGHCLRHARITGHGFGKHQELAVSADGAVVAVANGRTVELVDLSGG